MRGVSLASVSSNVTIRISGKLFQGHLAYLDHLIQSASDCDLWPSLDLAQLTALDRAALFYLMGGEGGEFGIVSCPNFIREWLGHEKRMESRTRIEFGTAA